MCSRLLVAIGAATQEQSSCPTHAPACHSWDLDNCNTAVYAYICEVPASWYPCYPPPSPGPPPPSPPDVPLPPAPPSCRLPGLACSGKARHALHHACCRSPSAAQRHRGLPSLSHAHSCVPHMQARRPIAHSCATPAPPPASAWSCCRWASGLLQRRAPSRQAGWCSTSTASPRALLRATSGPLAACWATTGWALTGPVPRRPGSTSMARWRPTPAPMASRTRTGAGTTPASASAPATTACWPGGCHIICHQPAQLLRNINKARQLSHTHSPHLPPPATPAPQP